MHIKKIVRALAISGMLISGAVAADEMTLHDAVALVHAGKGAEARSAFAELANAGNVEALYHLGALNHAGIGGEEDLQQAAYWYTLAADAGVPEAQLALGSLLYKGKGVQKDLARALVLFNEAAEKGLIAAQYNLAMMHTAGLAHTKEYNADEDKPRAYMWFTVVLAQLEDEEAKANVTVGLDFVAKEMTPWEIEQGKEMAAAWLANRGKKGTAQ